jgi:hypothetical protein
VSGASQTDSLADTRAHEPFALKMFIASTGYFTKRKGNFKLRKFSLSALLGVFLCGLCVPPRPLR